jgi:hypothetical protein
MQLLDAEWLRANYVDRARDVTDIASELGCGVYRVRRALREAGLPRRDKTGRLLPAELTDEDWLHQRYVGQGETVVAIAAELHCSVPAVRRALRQAGLARP